MSVLIGVVLGFIGVSLALWVGEAMFRAYCDERGRYSYTSHRRALRTLARTNPRRRKP